MTHYLNSTRLQRLAGIITEEQASYLGYPNTADAIYDRRENTARDKKYWEVQDAANAATKAVDSGYDRRSSVDKQADREWRAKQDELYKANMISAKQGDEAIARRDAEWERGRPAREKAEKTAKITERTDIAIKTLDAIRKYAEDYPTATQNSITKEMLSQIFVRGAKVYGKQVNADAALNSIDPKIIPQLSNLSWEDGLDKLEKIL